MRWGRWNRKDTSQIHRKDRKEREEHRKGHRIVDPSHHRFVNTDSTDDKDSTDLFSASLREPLNPTESPPGPIGSPF